ncbi:hypothetical protein [Halalkalibacter hemicellulosilyticus]|uniref:Uncharacterized protein n=1 Tax=Halalkalibacter hemicellulosilyticusJCM 9152 TaxID=1236971 RepID=W4QHS9_9BACI|nr:hypothetical protein [Halalkalibacter hemicellulosilyticus]GAE31656.1 hypothetical protein JCM9152_3138 [Halalkalibacter hemicellulosilyticusJCM 9152]
MGTYVRVATQLANRSPLPLLCPKERWNEKLTKEIMDLSDEELTDHDSSTLSSQAVRSGLLLWNDELELSHSISQGIPEEIGSLWHGMMHRREGDFSNAKYWFRLAGEQSVFTSLYEKASIVSSEVKSWGRWDPFRFIDEVEKVIQLNGEDSSDAMILREIQVLELMLFIDHSRSAL